MIDTICYVNGKLVKKSQAVISIYDSGFQHGDGVYEGIRVYNDKVFMLEEHIKRLYESCKSIDITLPISTEEMKKIVLHTFRENQGIPHLYMRLQVTRGLKKITGMNPRLNIYKPTIVCCVDSKPPVWNKAGITLITASVRRCPPDFLDSKIHNCNQLGQILACIESNMYHADEPIMLDINGFVAETAGTTLFMIKDGILFTPTDKYIMPGITRRLVLDIFQKQGYKTIEKDLSVHDFYNADEVFITGTQGEITPVVKIDGKKIGDTIPGIYTKWIAQKYHELTASLGTPL